MSYKVILQDQYDLSPLVEAISLRDSLEQVAYQGTVNLVVTPDMPPISPGMAIRISGIPYGKKDYVPLLHPAVVWEVETSNNGVKRMTLTLYDRTVYLDKSEDEYLFPAKQTATQRFKKYAADWNLKIAVLPDTEKQLGRSVYRTQSIYASMFADLRETAKAGGKLYHPRMISSGLELYELGTNKEVYILEAITDTTQSRTLEGAATKVKVLATAASETGKEVPSKVMAIEEKDIAKYGQLQAIIQDDEVKSPAAARQLARSKLRGIRETISLNAPDINTIRAGDAIMLGSMKLLVISVSRELGSPGSMMLELGSYDDVKRRFYLE
ncbi:phage portal protein [Paenibacillus sp. p3-SID867]|uniref:XkdQ/YqbQ family protein n=1 Tax=Paenibacillus sp. p3-SID867 TaxID=2916363 RepID=UPI0021A277ED|nr:phage portal protein [Paenibacillus sp. p3-SID867]MCT1401506.1 phage portal protein [Paenibacillus sp. p3-SID867]